MTSLRFLFLLLMIVEPVFAAQDVRSHFITVAQSGISQAQAIQIALSNTPGKVLSVNQQGNHFRIKILRQDGRVKTVVVDIHTGQIQ